MTDYTPPDSLVAAVLSDLVYHSGNETIVPPPGWVKVADSYDPITGYYGEAWAKEALDSNGDPIAGTYSEIMQVNRGTVFTYMGAGAPTMVPAFTNPAGISYHAVNLSATAADDHTNTVLTDAQIALFGRVSEPDYISQSADNFYKDIRAAFPALPIIEAGQSLGGATSVGVVADQYSTDSNLTAITFNALPYGRSISGISSSLASQLSTAANPDDPTSAIITNYYVGNEQATQAYLVQGVLALAGGVPVGNSVDLPDLPVLSNDTVLDEFLGRVVEIHDDPAAISQLYAALYTDPTSNLYTDPTAEDASSALAWLSARYPIQQYTPAQIQAVLSVTSVPTDQDLQQILFNINDTTSLITDDNGNLTSAQQIETVSQSQADAGDTYKVTTIIPNFEWETDTYNAASQLMGSSVFEAYSDGSYAIYAYTPSMVLQSIYTAESSGAVVVQTYAANGDPSNSVDLLSSNTLRVDQYNAETPNDTYLVSVSTLDVGSGAVVGITEDSDQSILIELDYDPPDFTTYIGLVLNADDSAYIVEGQGEYGTSGDIIKFGTIGIGISDTLSITQAPTGTIDVTVDIDPEGERPDILAAESIPGVQVDFAFTGSGEVLPINTIDAFTGTISDFQVGDTIYITGVGTLTPGTFTLAGDGLQLSVPVTGNIDISAPSANATPEGVVLDLLSDLGDPLTAAQLDAANYNYENPTGPTADLEHTDYGDVSGNGVYVSLYDFAAINGVISPNITGQATGTLFDRMPYEVVPAFNEVQVDNINFAPATLTNIQELFFAYPDYSFATLTQAQFNGASLIKGSPGDTIIAATGGTFDLTTKPTLDISLAASDWSGTTLIGNAENNETLSASFFGNDTLIAGNGSGDSLVSGEGIDTMIGGTGGDTFYVGSDSEFIEDYSSAGNFMQGNGGSNTFNITVYGDATDTIRNYHTDNGQSVIDFKNVVSADAVASQSGNDLVLTIGSDPVIVQNYFLGSSYQVASINFTDGVSWTPQDIPLTPVCFLRGTHIMMPVGEVSVEDLKIGDLVVTRFNGIQPIKWIGLRLLDCSLHPDPRKAWPVRVESGALGEGRPHRDLWLSPDHAVFIDDMLIPIRHLINGATIAQVPVGEVTYYHIELDRHDILLAEGLPAESYLDTGNRGIFENANEPLILYPDLATDDAQARRKTRSCATFAGDEARVKPVWERLAARSRQLGRPIPEATFSEDPGVHLEIDGCTIRPVVAEQDRCLFVLPQRAGAIRIVSRSGYPTDKRPWADDRRRLGVNVSGMVWYDRQGNHHDVPVDHPALAEGWWDAERDGRLLHRWTNGDALLPLPPAAIMVEFRIAGGMTYRLGWLEPEGLPGMNPQQMCAGVARIAASRSVALSMSVS